MRSRSSFLMAFILVLSASATAQQPPQRDPQALALAGQAMLALTNGLSVNDATLTGTATRIAGSDRDAGTVTLKALSTEQSRMDLTLSGGPRSEIRGLSGGSAAGSWSGPDGVAHSMALHNCWTDAVWFFPALSSLATLSRSDVSAYYIGQETRGGTSVQHLRFLRSVSTPSASTTNLIQHLSTVEIYLDSASLLPVALTFDVHPDNDAGLDIPIEIRFSGYHAVNGVHVPFHIQKYLNNGLVLDLEFQTASLNSGLTPSAFGVQ